MKSYYSIVVFLALVLSSVLAGVLSCKSAENAIVQDLDRALERTLAQKQELWITPDTIRDYRNNITLPQVRHHAYIAYCLPQEQRPRMSSHAMTWHKAGQTMAFHGYAECSLATVFSISDQRLSFSLFMLTILWGLLSLLFKRKIAPMPLNEQCEAIFGGIYYHDAEDTFYNLNHERIHLTPMQLELMKLFFASNNHRLSKEEICSSLWPKKENASETLYALIKRIRPVLSKNSSLTIDSDRGKAYRLTENNS